MKVFVVVFAVLGAALGQLVHHYPYTYSPFGYAHHLGVHPFTAYPYSALPYAGYPVAAHPYAVVAPAPAPAPLVVPSSSQYRVQDELGQFTFGTAGDNQARVETKRVDGTVTGAYSYVDPTGKQVLVNYLADHNGFRVLGANNLPEAPAPLAVSGPQPVKDTPEVEAARADFEKKFSEAEAAAAAAAPEAPSSRRRRQAVFYTSPVLPVPAPLLAKSTLKYNTFETVDAAVPADTKKAEFKEKELEVTHPLLPYAPLAYRAVVPSVYHSYHYGYPAIRNPFFYHI